MMLRTPGAKPFPNMDATGSTDATVGSTNVKGTMGSHGSLAIAQKQQQKEQQQGQDVYHALPRESHGSSLAATAIHSFFRGPKKLGGQRPNNVTASLQLSLGTGVNRNRTVDGEPQGGAAVALSINTPSERRLAGHYVKTPSERMLSELADSLADTQRKPSFARIQSMQVGVCVCVCLLFVEF